jgi:hypothetical protein
MKHKIAVTVAVTVVLGLFATELPQVRTKKESFPQKHLTIQKTYRGNQRIMVEMDNNGKKTRGFSVNGKIVAIEADEDGDGFWESLMVFDPDTGEFEVFAREKDGAVSPVSSERLEELRAKKERADRALSKLLQSSADPGSGLEATNGVPHKR